MHRVEVVPHNPEWRSQFTSEATQIKTVLGTTLLAIHHIGSTAIPGIYAKPIIDLLGVVTDLAALDSHTASLEGLGYEAMGEFGIPGRRYFRKYHANGDRSHHLHLFQQGSPEITRHLAFRDYLIHHPDDARAYSQLKRTLAQQHPHNIEAYMDGKDSLIRAIDAKASQFLQFHPPG